MPPRFIQSPYFATGDPETEEMTTLYAPGMLGCLGVKDRGSNNICTYRLVKQASTIQGIVGNVFCWSARATYTATTAVTNAGLPAGICGIASATPASYIWLAIKGNRPVRVQGSPTVAPDTTGAVQAVVSATAGVANGVSTAQVPQHLGAFTSAVTSNLANCQLAILDDY